MTAPPSRTPSMTLVGSRNAPHWGTVLDAAIEDTGVSTQNLATRLGCIHPAVLSGRRKVCWLDGSLMSRPITCGSLGYPFDSFSFCARTERSFRMTWYSWVLCDSNSHRAKLLHQAPAPKCTFTPRSVSFAASVFRESCCVRNCSRNANSHRQHLHQSTPETDERCFQKNGRGVFRIPSRQRYAALSKRDR